MTKPRIKKAVIFIVFWGILISSFCFFAILIVLKANGIQLDYHYWRLEKTGMIVLDGQPQNVQIKVNQKFLIDFPQKLGNLMPGNYRITISADQYKTWEETVKVEAGQAVVRNKIVLFYSQLSDNSQYQNLSTETILNEYQQNSQNIKIVDNEIYYNNKLISRFSNKILAASITPDNNHIFFQIADEIRVIDLDGSNNTLVIRLSTQEPSIFTFRDNENVLIYLDSGKVFAKNITG